MRSMVLRDSAQLSRGGAFFVILSVIEYLFSLVILSASEVSINLRCRYFACAQYDNMDFQYDKN